MDAFFFHPKVVHLPIALSLVLPLLSAGILIAWLRDALPGRAWWIAVALQALLVGSGIVAMRSGENEEELVEKVVAEAKIEAHEEAAEAFTWTAGGVLLLFVAAAVLPQAAAQRVAAAAIAGSFLVLFLGYRTGEAGGRLVYEHGAAQAYRHGAAAQADAVDLERDEDARHDEDDEDE